MSKSILIVEDELMLGELLQEFLQAEGFQVFNVATASQAVEEYNAHRPDLVITDYSLPDFNAKQLIQKLRAIDPQVIAVVVTGYVDQVEVSLNDGNIDALFPKPFKLDSLKHFVDKVFSNRPETWKRKHPRWRCLIAGTALAEAWAKSIEIRIYNISESGVFCYLPEQPMPSEQSRIRISLLDASGLNTDVQVDTVCRWTHAKGPDSLSSRLRGFGAEFLVGDEPTKASIRNWVGLCREAALQNKRL